MARKRASGLRRDIEAPAIAGAIFGTLAGAAFIVVGVATSAALGFTPVVFLIAGIAFLLSLSSYVEGISMLPQAGGSSNYARRAFNELVSFAAAWALVLDYLIAIALAAFVAAHYASSLPGLGVLERGPWDLVAAVVLIAIVALVTIQEVVVTANISIVVSLAAFVTQIVLAIVGLLLVFDPSQLVHSVHLGSAPTWGQVAFALPIAMIGFTGLEIAANLSEELRDPAHDLPRTMVSAGIVSVVLLVVISILGLSALPVQNIGGHLQSRLGMPVDQGGYQTDPFVGIVSHLGLGGTVQHVLRIYVAVLALGTLFVLANTAAAGLSRLAYSMSRHRQVPSALARIDRDAGAPAVAVVLFSLVAAALVWLTDYIQSSAIVLSQLYAFGAMFSLMVANAAIIRLRFTEPQLPRPFRAPLNVRVRNTHVPLSAVFGFLSAATIWIFVLTTHAPALTLGVIWMVIGFVGYGTYRLTHGLDMTERYAPHEVVAPVVQGGLYCKVLLAVHPGIGALGGGGDAELTALANKLVESDGEVALMVVHELPLTEPITAPLGDLERETATRLSRIRTVTEGLGLRLTTSVARSRAAGRAICQEAERRRSDAVIMVSRAKRRPGDAVFGKTVEYVLRHAPCDVVVLRFPRSVRPLAEREEGLANALPAVVEQGRRRV